MRISVWALVLLALLTLPALAQDDMFDFGAAPVKYVAVIELQGDADDPALAGAMMQHIAYYTQLYQDGVLYMIGPFTEGIGEGELIFDAGMIIVEADSLDHARALVEGDPAVQSGLVRVASLRPWTAPLSRGDGYAFFEAQGEQPPMDEVVPGQVVHLEFYSGDLGRSAEFYEGLFGWTTNEFFDGSYLLFMDAADKLGGGFFELPSGPGGALAYIYAPDIETALAQIEAAGGAVIREKTEIEGVGYYAVFSDPDGNYLALFSDR